MPITPGDLISYGKLAWGAITAGWRFLERGKRKLTPQQKLELRLRWKPEFEEWLAKQRQNNADGDILVRDIKRMDHYPDVRKGRGISAWFRGGLIYTYEKGIMVGLGWEGLKFTADDQLRFCNRDEESDITLMRTGYIPYECIERVDWDGDHYYSEPHIFCYFDQHRKQPYERVSFCERRGAANWEYWKEISDYYSVRKTSKKLGVKRW
jgi:hypothetical protein